MTRTTAAVMPSVLDRLLDEVPTGNKTAKPSRGVLVASIRQTLQRDLEWLLNTRRRPLGAAGKELAELKTALPAYGIPDFTTRDLSSETQRKAFARALEQAIRHFEPRLASVSVSIADRGGLERRLRFRIDALIRVEPAPEPVAFVSQLDPATQNFTIRAADHE
ncbi:type VI secretion protein [Aliidongia dinghuensis]|uniref:Type VI secretion protein n=1 Tax=Aliidongia dinghuensis TaxID=1867774 RepID=A0A8J2YTW3_9PROT|nr:type VI secretion system baseplate subunit TssE [Aliidongia dinghuensis]GGF20431.1 type VI secretion protein [Aliidongia dinghuensis]